MAYVTGVVLVVLCFVGIPLQVAGHPAVANNVGVVHGILYIIYLVFAWILSRKLGLAIKPTVIMLLAGNGLSWAYPFEWPLFAGFAVVFWAKTIKDEFRIKRDGTSEPADSEAGRDDLPVRVRPVQVSAGAGADDEDEELSAYNAYLARLNSEVKSHGRWHGLRS